MVSELQEEEFMSFPAVTLCRGINPDVFEGNEKEAVESNSKLENWIRYTFYADTYMLVLVVLGCF